jgi:molybdopterin-guanine dinucleotide biosynthesis protein B
MSTSNIIQIVGYKNSGKTHLICRLIRELRERGYRVGTAKHDGHEFEMDHAGRDTWRHYEAGAEAVAITSSSKTALIRRETATLEELAAAMPNVDVVLVEGFKSSPYPKIVLLRDEDDVELLDIVSGAFAVASWFAYRHPTLPTADIRDTSPLIHAVLGMIRLGSEEGQG